MKPQYALLGAIVLFTIGLDLTLRGNGVPPMRTGFGVLFLTCAGFWAGYLIKLDR